jgi:predicted transcriptional regulator
VGDLAAAPDRDYKRVHGDVAALEAIGLIVRDGTRLSAP